MGRGDFSRLKGRLKPSLLDVMVANSFNVLIFWKSGFGIYFKL
jgi:hypothetical protein